MHLEKWPLPHVFLKDVFLFQCSTLGTAADRLFCCDRPPVYFLDELNIFKKWPKYCAWERGAPKLCCLKAAWRKCDFLNLTAAKWLTHFCIWVNSICWRIKFIVELLNDPTVSSETCWLWLVYFLSRCMLNRNAHNTHHCIKCLLCGAVHRCVPALARWVICTACHTTECQWQQKYCTHAVTHPRFRLDCDVNQEYSQINKQVFAFTNVKYWDVSKCTHELNSMSNC